MNVNIQVGTLFVLSVCMINNCQLESMRVSYFSFVYLCAFMILYVKITAYWMT